MRLAKNAAAPEPRPGKVPLRVAPATGAARFAISRDFSASRALAQPARGRAALSPILAPSAKVKVGFYGSARWTPRFQRASKTERASGFPEQARSASLAVRQVICT